MRSLVCKFHKLNRELTTAMADSDEKPPRRGAIGGRKTIIAIVLTIAYLAAATYGVMSDTSVSGLTVKMYNVSRSCPSSNAVTTLNYYIQGSIWSASSLATTINHASFTLSVDGAILGTTPGPSGSFSPGHSLPQYSANFTNPTLTPTKLPLSSQLVLTLTATVSAGLYTGMEVASDHAVWTFGTTSC